MANQLGAKDRNWEFPWGYWLIANMGGQNGVVDEHGQHWQSVRHCLWRTRLGMPEVHDRRMNEMLDYLLSLLAILHRYAVGSEERLLDISLGGSLDAEFMDMWMQGLGLFEPALGPGRVGDLTAEGYSILLMLLTTRPANEIPPPIGLQWINPRQSPHHGIDRKRQDHLIGKHEAYASLLDERFERRMIAGKPTVVLICRDHDARMPLQVVIWSVDFVDNYACDRFYIWLLSRIDRWKHWAELAMDRGSRALSDHLVTLAFCDVFVSDDQNSAPL